MTTDEWTHPDRAFLIDEKQIGAGLKGSRYAFFSRKLRPLGEEGGWGVVEGCNANAFTLSAMQQARESKSVSCRDSMASHTLGCLCMLYSQCSTVQVKPEAGVAV